MKRNRFVLHFLTLFGTVVLFANLSTKTSERFVYAQSNVNASIGVDEAAYDQARSISTAFRQAAQKTLPASVKIVVKKGTNEVKSGKSKLPLAELLPELHDKDLIEGAGSGFIVDPSGVIVTNCHVVQDIEVGKNISVELYDGRRFPAKSVVKDEKADVAIVTIETSEQLPSLSFANSDLVEIGDWVLAIGNPFMLGSSVSAGIISAKERFRDSKLFIQTDAAVNPGNSGGPLINLRGEVVGINTAIASLSGGYQGVGFAIPANTASWVASQLREKGRVERAFLGAPTSIIEYNEARKLNLTTLTGVRIGAPFKDSPAAKAGLKANDVLLSLDNRPIESPEAFEAFIERIDVNKDFKLKILRNNATEPLELTIRFAIKPDGYVGIPQTEKLITKGVHKLDKEWGIMIIPSTPESAARIGSAGQEGIVVLNVTPGSLAYRSGLRNGALILKMNGIEVKTLEDYDSVKYNGTEGEIELEYNLKSERKTARLKVKKVNQ